jgi:hypothetical protein
MRKMMLLAAMVALAALMLAAAPALAADDNDRKDNDNNNENHENSDFGDFIDEFCEDSDGDLVCDFDEFCEDLDGNLVCDLEELCEDFDGDLFCDKDEDNLDGFGDLEELFQTSEQEAESGDADQSFDISGSGANSNQCVGAQGVANTGNAQISLNILNFGELDDFELEDLESSLTVDPTNTTTCDQEVNQAATAFGGYDYGGADYGGGYNYYY